MPESEITIVRSGEGDEVEARFVFKGRPFAETFYLSCIAQPGDTAADLRQRIVSKCEARYAKMSQRDRWIAQAKTPFVVTVHDQDVSVVVNCIDTEFIEWAYKDGNQSFAQKIRFTHWTQHLDFINLNGLSAHGKEQIRAAIADDMNNRRRKATLPTAAIQAFLDSVPKDDMLTTTRFARQMAPNWLLGTPIIQ